METKMIVFVYKELSSAGFNQLSQRPFPLSESAQTFAADNFKLFKSLGGIRIVDYYNSPCEFIRLSFWSSADAYEKWENHPLIQSYIETRKIYHNDNNIKTQLSGPFQASTYE